MTIAEMIEKFQINLEIRSYETREVGLRVYGKPTAAELAELKENKPAIIAHITAEREAKVKKEAADEAAKVRFYSCGWESHQIIIDTRKNIESQLKSYAKNYASDGLTIERLTEDYDNEIARREKEEADKKAENERKQAVFATAKATGEKQKLLDYMDECNDPREECSQDYVIVWAMPDGTTKKERSHCW